MNIVGKALTLSLILSVGAAFADTQLAGSMSDGTSGSDVFEMNTPKIFAAMGTTQGQTMLLQVELLQESGTGAVIRCAVGVVRSAQEQPELCSTTDVMLDWGVSKECSFEVMPGVAPITMTLTALPSFLAPQTAQ